MFRRALLVLALVLPLAAACGGDDSDDADSGAEDALRQQFDYLSKGQYVRAYSRLHPAQQAVISEELYVQCAGQLGTIEFSDIEIVEVFEEEVTIPGTSTRAASTAITARVTASQGSDSETITDTFHEFLVDGEWRFAVADVSDYDADEC
jgi:hypothetical protein